MTKSSQALTTDLVFEIQSEELPATNLADLFEVSGENALLTRAKKAFVDMRIETDPGKIFATPRRLVFYFEAVALAQSAKDTFIKVLSKDEAYGADGKPAEKLLSILKHRNAKLEDTVLQDLNGKPYVFIKRSEAVQKLAEILPEILEKIVRSLNFPKNMRWGYRWADGSDLVFPRPIRGFLCVLGSGALKTFKLAGIPVTDSTVFFMATRRESVSVESPEAYFKLLKKMKILLDPIERKQAIQKDLEACARAAHGDLLHDPFLLNEVNFLVERPRVIAAKFHEEFLALPREVLTVSMARKQRIFALEDKQGKIAPNLLGVLDGALTVAEEKEISKNYENILHAKLQDSLFFYGEDSKMPLGKKRAALKDLIFLKDAGSMLQKSDRLVNLAKTLGTSCGIAGDEQKFLAEAASLCKADLLSLMVGEFPELQGIMGKYYSMKEVLDPTVSEAIGEHYLPRLSSDPLPKTRIGALLSIFDKIDLIVACFATRREPTSSLDPFGLRRSAMAILKMIVDKKFPLSISRLIEQTISELSPYISGAKPEDLSGKVFGFLRERFEALLSEEGYNSELIAAVLKSGFDSPSEVYDRLNALSRISKKDEFLKVCKVLERTTNILKGCKDPLNSEVNATLFQESLETALHNKYSESRSAIESAKAARDFARVTSLYAEAFFDILNEFFAKVFINAEDPAVRKNRLTLLKLIRDLYAEGIADLSQVKSASPN